MSRDELVKELEKLGAEDGNPVTVEFINICRAPITLYWLHHNRQSEEYLSTVPENHRFFQATDYGQVFRVKWADPSNRGLFNEDIIEEYVIEEHAGLLQEIRICLHARREEERRNGDGTAGSQENVDRDGELQIEGGHEL